MKTVFDVLVQNKKTKVEKQKKKKKEAYMWHVGIIDFEYRQSVDVTKGPSDRWFDDVVESIEEVRCGAP